MRSTNSVALVIGILLVLALAACGERTQSAPPPAAEEAAPSEVEPSPAAAGRPEPTPSVPESTAPTPEPAATANEAAASPPSTIEFELYKAGFIVGVSGGRGTLHFRGRAHPISIGGVSVGATAGVSRAELIGQVRNLHRLEDIEGTYSATQAGLTLGGGEKITHLENARKVRLEVRGKQIGIEVAVDLNGMQISLAR
jgi:hypothetical protein